MADKRRKLRFDSVDAAIAEAESLVQFEREGKLKHIGNWTLGQALGHLSIWVRYSLDGYPPEVKAPLLARILLRMIRGLVLHYGMSPGVRGPTIAGGTPGTELISSEQGLAQFQHEMKRLKAAPPAQPNPVFGRMTHRQWIDLNLRHAELHLSFQIPKG